MEIEKLYEYFSESEGVSTDTRKIKANRLFFALKGDRFNGNMYAKQALDSGASFAVVDEEKYAEDENCILVNNVLETLQKLANYHRRQFRFPFIGITGSNGKTTTKELITRVLRKRYKVHATEGNLNNHIGVPLTLLSMPSDTQVAVIEMGANKVGDIAELCSIAEPTHGLITNIGYAHVEGFGGIEGVLKGKTELYNSIFERKGVIFVNSQDEKLAKASSHFKTDNRVLFGSPEDFLSAELLNAEPYIRYRNSEGKEYQTVLFGDYNFNNILSALAIGRFFHINSTDANEAVSSYSPDNQRSELITENSCTIIMDAYNANPGSMSASLKSFSELKASKRIAVLGDMLELGDESLQKHCEVLDLCSDLGIDEVLLCGEVFGKAKEKVSNSLQSISHFENTQTLKAYLEEVYFENTAFLLKASRGTGLEKVLPTLKEHCR